MKLGALRSRHPENTSSIRPPRKLQYANEANTVPSIRPPPKRSSLNPDSIYMWPRWCAHFHITMSTEEGAVCWQSNVQTVVANPVTHGSHGRMSCTRQSISPCIWIRWGIERCGSARGDEGAQILLRFFQRQLLAQEIWPTAVSQTTAVCTIVA